MDKISLSEPTTYDAEGRVVKVGSLARDLDPEAQNIRTTLPTSSKISSTRTEIMNAGVRMALAPCQYFP